MQRLLIFFSTFFLLNLFFSFHLMSANFLVDSYEDKNDLNPGDGVCSTDEGTCTVRAAITESNAFPGLDSIFIPKGDYSLKGDPLDDENFSGDLDIHSEIFIEGEGARLSILRGPPDDRVIHFLNGSIVTLKNLTIRDGYIVEGDGAGILSENADLIIQRCSIESNINKGDLLFNGGGIKIINGKVDIIESIIKGNDSGNRSGGGLALKDGKVLLRKVTIHNNQASHGGGIHVSGESTDLSIFESTITSNQAISNGGGIYTTTFNFIIKNTIVANNEGGSNDCKNLWYLHGYNLIGQNCLLESYTETDIFGDFENPLDPELGVLQNNGGPTDTQAPLPGSPIIGAGGECGEIDQRGFLRDQPCNIGAFQFSCGDGIKHGIEECDDGNEINGDDCDNNCTLPACGNGEQAPGEECDDGNTIEGDGCDMKCQIEVTEYENQTTIGGDNEVASGGGCQIVKQSRKVHLVYILCVVVCLSMLSLRYFGEILYS